MVVTTAIRKSHYYNEDRIIIGNSYFMVCDGATSLYNSGISPTEGSWFVSFIKKHLRKNHTNIIEELNSISQKAYKEFFKLSENYDDVLYFPSAGLAWAEIKNSKLYVYTIGDCEAVIRTKDNRIIQHLLPSLPELDKKALEAINKTKEEKQVTIKKATELCKDILVANRKLMNQKNGYTVYTISDKPNFEFACSEYDINELSEVYLYTDGITQAFDELQIYPSYQEMFSQSIDLNEEIKKIVKRAYEDKYCNFYPRFKTIDDIAIIKIVFD